MGVLAVEMEAAGLYMNAARAGKRALGLFTISDHIYRAEELTSEQRQNSFVQMITIALDTAVNRANLLRKGTCPPSADRCRFCL